MVAVSTSFLLFHLLAASNHGSRGVNQRWHGAVSNRGRNEDIIGGRGRVRGRSSTDEMTGRRRYNRSGTKRKRSSDNIPIKEKELHPLPPLTKPNLPRPSYFNCRHTYENTLVDEIHRYANHLGGSLSAMTPYPGLVRVEDKDKVLPLYYDPIYALQSIPNAVVVSGDSIKGIAKEISSALFGEDENSIHLREKFRMAPRGSLTIHAIVPGMCKGQTKPMMHRRCEKICEELANTMQKVYPAARPSTPNPKRWILQIFLQSPTIAVASLTECQRVGPGNAFWPNYYHALGLAKVDISTKMPSSAYRKLMEALECMGITPSPSSVAVDLGASPGGWTSVLRRLGCSVVAVDRSKLDPGLMNDEMVDYVKGDAFTFEPTVVNPDWMVSDVIAYPDRCTELLERWCSEHWAKHMVVTMKFQGEDPAFDEIDRAIDVVKTHGYTCRVKHFFNNKNEVTFMISEADESTLDLEVGGLGESMYPVIL